MASYDFSQDRDKLRDLSGSDRSPYKKADLEREGFVEQSPGAYVDGGRDVAEDLKDPAKMLPDNFNLTVTHNFVLISAGTIISACRQSKLIFRKGRRRDS